MRILKRTKKNKLKSNIIKMLKMNILKTYKIKKRKKRKGGGIKNNKITLKKSILKKSTFKKLKCAPGQLVDGNLKKYTCYSNKDLFDLKENWNKNNPQEQINSNNTKEIWLFLKKKLNNKCKNELCWLNTDRIKNNSINKKNIFRPIQPNTWKKNKYEWLSSLDIINVMKQYKRKYLDFEFIGPSPIDFDNKELYGTCVWEELCKFDLNKYYLKNIRKIGIIFNLDDHTKSGSHWVALYIDINKKYIFYFDSNGNKIPKEIKNLVDRVLIQATEMNIHLEFNTNEGMVHQKKDGQCGMYCLYFIIELLENRLNYDYFINNRITDEMMMKYREEYFNEL